MADTRFRELLSRCQSGAVGKVLSASEWQEILEFISDNLCTQDERQAEYDRGRAQGYSEGRNAAKKRLMDISAVLFLEHKDGQACRLRELSEEIGRL